MATLAARHGRLHALCFLYWARSCTYSDTAVSLQRFLIACLELHFLTSLRQDHIIAEMSPLSGVNNARASSRACPSDGRDSCSESCVRSGRSPSVSSAAIIAICVHHALGHVAYISAYLAPSHPYLRSCCSHSHSHRLPSVQDTTQRAALSGALLHHWSLHLDGLQPEQLGDLQSITMTLPPRPRLKRSRKDSLPIALTLLPRPRSKRSGGARLELQPIALTTPEIVAQGSRSPILVLQLRLGPLSL